MDMTVLGYIVGIIIAAFSSGGLWSWLSARKKPQIDMLTATAAASNSAGEMALAVAKRADERSAALEVKMVTLEDRLDRWQYFGIDLVARWPEHRKSPAPPLLPE